MNAINKQKGFLYHNLQRGFDERHWSLRNQSRCQVFADLVSLTSEITVLTTAPEPNKKMASKILNEKNIAKLKEQKRTKACLTIATESFFSCTPWFTRRILTLYFDESFFFPHYVCFISNLFFPKIWKSSNWHLLLGNGYSKDLGGTLKRWRNVMSGDKHEVKWHYGMLLMVLSGGRRIFEVCAT